MNSCEKGCFITVKRACDKCWVIWHAHQHTLLAYLNNLLRSEVDKFLFRLRCCCEFDVSKIMQAFSSACLKFVNCVLVQMISSVLPALSL